MLHEPKFNIDKNAKSYSASYNEIKFGSTGFNVSQSIPAVEISIGGGIYIVNGFFKVSGKSVSEKFYGLMEKEMESPDVLRYNKDIPQESLAVGVYKEDMK